MLLTLSGSEVKHANSLQWQGVSMGEEAILSRIELFSF